MNHHAMNHHAVHYFPPRPPMLHRFATAEDREAWIADHPDMRRAIAAPADQTGYLTGPVTVAGAQVSAGFRVAGLDDLFPPVTELRDAMIDRLKGAAVSPPWHGTPVSSARFTRQEVADWIDRNGFQGSHTEAKTAMDDAASLHLLRS